MRLPALDTAELPYRWIGVSAIEHYLGQDPGDYGFLAVRANLAEFAVHFETLSFPGLDNWDAVIWHQERTVFVRLMDDDWPEYDAHGSDLTWHSFQSDHPLLRFAFEPATRRFLDPDDAYRWLSACRNGEEVSVPGEVTSLVGGAILTSRFPITWEEGLKDGIGHDSRIDGRAPFSHPFSVAAEEAPMFHRMVLSSVLTGPYASRGLEMLMRGGYLPGVFPELVSMESTEHSKEGHPEGNVWRHTLETFNYRKSADLTVGLALLFHDAGKPGAEPNGNRRFYRHADIGARLAARILGRVGFDTSLIDAVQWLVRYHMVPGALERLPPYRRNPIMASQLFPKLLEVYRCDLSSTFRGPDGYYRACKVYRRFLKNHANPFRDASGKKAVQMYVA